MFRTPRENSSPTIVTPVKPSIGRPPTPPNGQTPYRPLPPMATASSAKPLTPRPNSKSNISTSRPSVKKIPAGKAKGKPNGSILNFFQKVDSPLKDDSIFLPQRTPQEHIPTRIKSTIPDSLEAGINIDDLYEADEEDDAGRFNESTGSVKKRKTCVEDSQADSQIQFNDVNEHTEDMEEDMEEDPLGILQAQPLDIGKQPSGTLEACTPPPPPAEPPVKEKAKKNKRRGPFYEDSDTDNEFVPSQVGKIAQDIAVAVEKRDLRTRVLKQPEEMNNHVTTKPISQDDIEENRPIVPEVHSVVKARRRVDVSAAQAKWEALQPKNKLSSRSDSEVSENASQEPRDAENVVPAIPQLKKENMSVDEWEKFEEFPDEMDEFAVGEEFFERKWIQDQELLNDVEGFENETFNGFSDDEPDKESPKESMTATCPICDSSLGGISADEATRHVNGCLDGDPVSLPEKVKLEPKEVTYIPAGASKRFQKAAIARPGQANPFDLGSKSEASSSAFSKLMAGHAENAAWATAAAAEHSSRGKMAYQRTCPFYKIMPGFFICVDAFRYGAVQGCNAYFLSHFHSDHYVGLTSSWCHGPIYCSKVTANLVKQQLKVDPKWVVSLNFEERFEVPGTEGVDVTMIPANHCPGSSLYLFEKPIGKGKNPKIQRVLHCGDFRACPAHVEHPLLIPDTVDSISGKTKQQKIDVCYLDTTYLNPRYSFPSQEAVITACVDMCISLRKERAEESDAWEQVKRERAGTGMQKFVQHPTLKAEDCSDAMALGSTKTRGRLLVVCGTYSIGKERICMGIARALDCKIWAPNRKIAICAALEDPELMSRITDNPLEAQIHMQMLMELRPETLADYLTSYKPHFSRIVGFRPSGWNYKPPNSRFTDSPTIQTVLNSPNWHSKFTMADLVPQRGSTKEASCFGVPYSEHSSFRELTMFVCALRIEKVVPTVNVGSAASRSKMKAWIEKWSAERRKNGVIKIGAGEGEVKWGF